MDMHDPYIGPDYESSKPRIGIIGFSHYVDDKPDYPGLTNTVVRDVIAGKRYAFFTAIMNAFGESQPARFWGDKMFFNILPFAVGNFEQKYRGPVGDEPGVAKARFQAYLNWHKPDAVIIFTRKGWWLLPDSTRQNPDDPEIVWYDRNDGQTLVIGSRHPQGSSAERLSNDVRKLHRNITA